MQPLSRRKFLQAAGVLATTALASACQPKVVEKVVTKEVEKVVEKVVKETVIIQGTPQVVEKTVKEVVTATPAPKEVVTISYSTWMWPARQQVVDETIRRFEAKQPYVKVKLEGYPWGEYFDKVTVLIAGDAAPDVVHVWVDQAQIFIQSGYVLDLDPYVEADNFDTSIFPPCIDIAVYDGHLYGFPRDGGVFSDQNIYYSRTIFDELGVDYPNSQPKDPQAGWTFEEFLEVAKQLTRDQDGDGKTDIWGFITGFGDFQLLPTIWSWGGDIFNEDYTKCILDSDEAVAATQWYADLRVKHHVTPFSEDIEGMGDIFMTGMAGMNRGPVMYGNKLNTAGVEFDWSIAELPRGEAGEINLAATHPIMITKTSKHPDAAWEWLKYTVSYENQYYQAIETVSFPPQTIPVARLEEWVVRDKPPYSYAPFAYGETRTIPKTKHYRRIKTEILNPEWEPVWLGTKTAAEVNPIIAEKINNFLAEQD